MKCDFNTDLLHIHSRISSSNFQVGRFCFQCFGFNGTFPIKITKPRHAKIMLFKVSNQIPTIYLVLVYTPSISTLIIGLNKIVTKTSSNRFIKKPTLTINVFTYITKTTKKIFPCCVLLKNICGLFLHCKNLIINFEINCKYKY